MLTLAGPWSVLTLVSCDSRLRKPESEVWCQKRNPWLSSKCYLSYINKDTPLFANEAGLLLGCIMYKMSFSDFATVQISGKVTQYI